MDQARALLRVIPRTYPQGLRDYALFLAYLLTGRRNSEIRNLRWGDFESETLPSPKSCFEFYPEYNEGPGERFGRGAGGEGRVFYRWEGKGKSRRDVCPLSLWKAIIAFLKAADRLDTITPDDYIFTALNNNASRLPNVRQAKRQPYANQSSKHTEPCSLGEPNCRAGAKRQPLTDRFVRSLLKRYAYRAGLDPRRITVHTLRHTAAMLRVEAGEDLEAISQFLNHSSLSVTQIYLHQVEGHEDTAWLKVEALLGLSGD